MRGVVILVAGLVGFGIGGCALESADTEHPDQTSEALLWDLKAGQKDAQIVLDAILRSDLGGIPDVDRCQNLRHYVSKLEVDIANGTAVVENHGPGSVFGLRANLYKITENNPNNPLVPYYIGLYSQQCWQKDPVSLFLVIPENGLTVLFDPGPATLTENLSATKGASAAASALPYRLPTRAYQWPATYTSGGVFVGGEPCTTVARSAGFVTSGNIQKIGSFSKCVCPIGGC